MNVSTIIQQEAVITRFAAVDYPAAVQELVAALAATKRIDHERVVKDVELRERQGVTLAESGERLVAFPHAFSSGCRQFMIAVGCAPDGLEWNGAANGKKVNLVFLLVGPPQTHALYLHVLGRISSLCTNPAFVEELLLSSSGTELIQKLHAAEASLGDISPGEELPSFCILGAGHGGMAMAAHLALLGCRVNLFNRTARRIEPVLARGGLDVTGEVDGFAPLRVVSTNPAEAIDGCDILMMVVPATAHRNMAEIIAPHIRNGQVLILNPGRTGGALEVRRILRERNPQVRPFIAEAQTLLYASRVTNPGQVHIFGIKNSVPLATLPAYHSADVLPWVRKALPQFVPGDNVLKTSLDNIGAVFHPAITILNAGRIEDTHGDFEYYVEGVTPAVAAVLEAIDAERVAVAAALGIRANTAREWLYLAYDAAGKTLYDAMHANGGYAGIKAPGVIQHRYISEDVPASLVPIASIGEMFGVKTPAIRAMITMGSVMHGVDYWAEGRTVERLGINGMSLKELRFLVVGAENDTPAGHP